MGGKLILLFVELFLVVHSQIIEEGKPCTANNDLCKSVESCTELQESMMNGYQPKICSFNGTRPIICCTTPKSVQTNDLVKQSDYGRKFTPSLSEIMCINYMNAVCPRSVQYAVGGTPAKGKELPFMARIGFEISDSENSEKISWLCGGSLISEYFILSAAHCTKSQGVPAKYVKLGELDASTDTDDAAPEDFLIVQAINHPSYNEKWSYHDISLYRLERQVRFNRYIRPICLQQSDSFQQRKTVVAAGWGKTEKRIKSDKLMKVDLNLYRINTCRNLSVPSVLPFGLDEKTQICSGTLEGGRDTCNVMKGDSGGPLFFSTINNNLGNCILYTQIGITSLGVKVCGSKDYPALYTKVSAYRNWIESIVWGPTGYSYYDDF